MRLCVYAITGPGPLQARTTRGYQGERLRLVAAGPVAAIVGDLPRAPRPTVAQLRRYGDTMRRLAAERPALLPARFGTCFGTPDELLEVLRSRRASLRPALRHVRLRAQMTIRIVSPEHMSRDDSPAMARRQSSRRRGGTGAAYLRQRAADAARRQEIPGFEAVRQAVRRWVRAERVDRRAGVSSVYHLVPRGAAGAYRATLARAAAESGLRMVVSGPWPPYAFATL